MCACVSYSGLPYGQNGQFPRAPRSRGPALAEGVIENQKKRGKQKEKKEKRKKKKEKRKKDRREEGKVKKEKNREKI